MDYVETICWSILIFSLWKIEKICSFWIYPAVVFCLQRKLGTFNLDCNGKIEWKCSVNRNNSHKQIVEWEEKSWNIPRINITHAHGWKKFELFPEGHFLSFNSRVFPVGVKPFPNSPFSWLLILDRATS